jgi:hypothetical protein
MPGDQSRSTVEIAEFTIDTTQTNKVPIKNGDRCCVNETTLNCDAVLTLLDKNNSGNDETLFSLSINNYDSRINDEMKNSLENYKNVIYYNSQLKKFYSSYSDDHKEIVKQKISHILILGKTETLFKSKGIYTFTIDKTILIYEASHANITSAKESHPVLTMFEYFNLIYIDWFSLLLSDFYKEFKKIKSVMPQEVLSARAASTEADSRADSESEADSEADFLVGEGEGEEAEEGEGGAEEGEGGAEEGEGSERKGATQKAQRVVKKFITDLRLEKGLKKMNTAVKRMKEEEKIYGPTIGGSSFGKKKGKKTKKVKLI